VPTTELTVMIFPDRCFFLIGATALTVTLCRTDSFRQKLQKRRIKGTRFGVHRPTPTAAGIRDEDIDTPPGPGRNKRLSR
jgi:hypothetical protein